MAGVGPDPLTKGEPLDPQTPPSRVTRERISYNAITRLVGRTVGAILTVVALRLATHYFGAARWGVITAASALAALFVGVCDLGITTIASREVANPRNDSQSVYADSIVGVLLVGIPLMAVMAGLDYAIYVDHRAIRDLGLVLLPLIPLNSLWLVGGAVLVAKARNDLRAVIDIATSVCLLAGTAATVEARLGTASYLWIVVAMNGVGALMALGFARFYVRARLRRATRSLAMMRRSAPIGATQVLSSLNSQVNTILLSLFAATAVVGAFGLAYQVAVFGVAVPPMLTAAILPKFVAADDLRRQRMMQTAFDVLAVVAAVIPLLAVLFARSVVLAIGGRQFSEAVLPLILLSIFAAFAFPARVFLDCLIYINAERKLLTISCIVTAMNIVLAFVLIPFTHATGAALAMLVGSVAALVLGWQVFHRIAGYSVSGVLGIKAVIVSCGLLGLYGILHVTNGLRTSTGWLLIPEGFAVSVIYLAVLGLWGGVRRMRETTT